MNAKSNSNRFAITTDPTEDEVQEFQKGLEAYNMEQTNGEFNSPQPWLSLVLKDHEGTILGGILTSTLYWTQYLEVLWVDEKYRGLGYGRDLVLEAHRLGKEQGCVSSHTYTFSWQAPEFYQAVGYKLIATYDGYVEGIKEHILMKILDTLDDVKPEKVNSTRFTIIEDSTPESQTIVRRGLGSNFDKFVSNVLKKFPHTGFNFILKNAGGEVIGGINGYTTLGTMNIEGLWIAEPYRGQGHGKSLLQHAEKLAKERGCIANQSACFTFQNLEFFKKQGFKFYGHTDAYPNEVKEYFLVKKY
ncbi:MAG: GNAT family N-acetyltransferase [Candidatus Thorarchaeota archaeon]|nr:MAG: GNAT family N-acetyltransferase [Candidatus Thorarchaeota archaeon]